MTTQLNSRYVATKLWLTTFGKMVMQDEYNHESIYSDLLTKDNLDYRLTTECERLPQFHYFENINGKNYVVKYHSDDANTVYEVTGDFGLENPCAVILRDTIWDYDGDGFLHTSYYRIEPKLDYAKDGDTNVVIWVNHNYKINDDTPYDRYLELSDIKENDLSAIGFFEKHNPMVFDTYKDAKAWIEQQEAKPYQLKHNEIKRPCYRIINPYERPE